jgi:DNA-binding NtrC family response regulator
MRRRPKLLLVDDGERYVELFHHFLRDYDYATRCELPGPCWACPQRGGCTLTHAHDGGEAEAALRRHPDVDVVLLDVAFDVPVERLLPARGPTRSPEGEPPAQALQRRRRLQGLEILAHLRRERGELPVVLLTAQEELAYADAAEALAVDEFVTLAGSDAFDARALGLLIERVLAHRAEQPALSGYLFGSSPAMRRLQREAQILARTSFPVLLLGETGTGKSALAEQVLHPSTGRKGPFVSVDIAALPESLVAAELFGTARGAFSGAVEREGRFERAHEGTLLLDEIGNLPLDVQRMLLLVLQDGRVTRIGESTPRPVSVRVLAATNLDLCAAVRAGRFRADLYARLNPAARLLLPPLRERLVDLEALVRGLLRKTFAAGPNRALLCAYQDAAQLGGPPQVELLIARGAPAPSRGVRFVLSPASMQALRGHPWPGNVRELEWLIDNAAVFALADALRAAEAGRAPSGTQGTVPIPAKLVRELLARSAYDLVGAAPGGSTGSAAALSAGAPAAGAPSADEPAVRPARALREVAQELERALYERLYDETSGDFAAMARRLLIDTGARERDARRVRLRYNQLGLRVRRRS